MDLHAGNGCRWQLHCCTTALCYPTNDSTAIGIKVIPWRQQFSAALQLFAYKRETVPWFLKVTPMAPMGGGTQLFEGAHLTGDNTHFHSNQADVAIMCF